MVSLEYVKDWLTHRLFEKKLRTEEIKIQFIALKNDERLKDVFKDNNGSTWLDDWNTKFSPIIKRFTIDEILDAQRELLNIYLDAVKIRIEKAITEQDTTTLIAHTEQLFEHIHSECQIDKKYSKIQIDTWIKVENDFTYAKKNILDNTKELNNLVKILTADIEHLLETFQDIIIELKDTKDKHLAFHETILRFGLNDRIQAIKNKINWIPKRLTEESSTNQTPMYTYEQYLLQNLIQHNYISIILREYYNRVCAVSTSNKSIESTDINDIDNIEASQKYVEICHTILEQKNKTLKLFNGLKTILEEIPAVHPIITQNLKQVFLQKQTEFEKEISNINYEGPLKKEILTKLLTIAAQEAYEKDDQDRIYALAQKLGMKTVDRLDTTGLREEYPTIAVLTKEYLKDRTFRHHISLRGIDRWDTRVTRTQIFAGGFDPRETAKVVSPEQYTKKIMNILQNGLEPSDRIDSQFPKEHPFHELQEVWVFDNVALSDMPSQYGIVFIKFKIHNMTLFKGRYDTDTKTNELFIFTKRLKEDFEVVFSTKSIQYHKESYDDERNPLCDKESGKTYTTEEYVAQIKQILQQNNIPFSEDNPQS